MKRIILLILISALPYQLSACGQEINANRDVESGPARSIESSAATPDEPALAKDASDILTRMTDFISGVPAYSLVSDTGHEVMQRNGQLLEFDTRLTLAIQRPSHAIGRFDSRNGDSSITVLDGEAISVYSGKENIYVYETSQQPGDIDTSLEFLANQIRGSTSTR